MAYEALARKWRPKNFSELIGQDAVRQTLSNSLRQNRLYPVLLFTGPRGTGKTSSARILAKSLRCPNKKDLTPCDQCGDCRLIQDSRHLDVMEIDGASNNGVEAVRELRGAVSYMPSTGFWKIYIIDEAHMLSHSAFNALLKTLEEPPDHVLFIMATTESHKIPQTVLSRAQKLDFRLLSPALIKRQLEKICQKEDFPLSDDILWMIAKQARGSLRDGQSLLDHVVSFCGEDISPEKTAGLLGLSDPYILSQTLQAIVQRKEGRMIELIDSLRSKGADPRLFLQSLIEALSQLLLIKKNPENRPPLVQASEREIERMKEETASASYEGLHFLFDMLLKAERELAFCHDSQLALEVLLLRFCAAPRLESLAPLSPLKGGGEGGPPEKLRSLSRQARGQKGGLSQKPGEKPPLKNPAGDKSFERGFEFVEFLRKRDQALAGLAENLSLRQKSPGHFCFGAPKKNPFLQDKIAQSSVRGSLEKQLRDFLRCPEKTRIEFSSGKEGDLSLREEREEREKSRLLSQAQKNPFVQEITSLFGGTISRAVKRSE